ncbi:ParA family protein [Spirochaeta thermophila]|uniref:Cobyrinic acid a,c-diamide synthase n=1 Tax=Winmispira thermophila (strain ATCC 49972 / DSM 6192 / RI 19.B1) TaxID=665571 RepID=E0RRD0_WINT6|nr:ParA family protein [Spirochaeta thermophila]ADN03107.1 cobyrinic acid a,c-diamide synthase [Spirochaeta thermophila DSM 6192]
MKVVSVYNVKGGVGKTTCAVNLAFLAARDGYTTLLWDLDPQGGATFYLTEQTELTRSPRKILSKKSALLDAVIPTPYRDLFLLPADLSLRNVTILLDEMKRSRERIHEQLEKIGDRYDLVLLDAPPGLSLLSENLFSASDRILLPLVPTPLSLRAYLQISAFFSEHDLPAEKILPFFNMVDRRKRIHRTTLEEYSRLPEFLSAWIPHASAVEEMGKRRKPLPAFSRTTTASLAFLRLWEELKGNVGLTRDTDRGT